MENPADISIKCEDAIPILDGDKKWIMWSVKEKKGKEDGRKMSLGKIIRIEILHGMDCVGNSRCHKNCLPPFMAEFSVRIARVTAGKDAKAILNNFVIHECFPGIDNLKDALVAIRNLWQDLDHPFFAIKVEDIDNVLFHEQT